MGNECHTPAPASGDKSPADNHAESRREVLAPTPPTHPTSFLDAKRLLKEKLPISRRTLFTWERDGKIPVVKIGRRKLFHWPSVEAALLRLQRGGSFE